MTSITIKLSRAATKASDDSIIIYAVKSDDNGAQLLGSSASNQTLETLNLKALGVTGAVESSHRIPVAGQTAGLIGVGNGISSTTIFF